MSLHACVWWWFDDRCLSAVWGSVARPWLRAGMRSRQDVLPRHVLRSHLSRRSQHRRDVRTGDGAKPPPATAVFNVGTDPSVRHGTRQRGRRAALVLPSRGDLGGMISCRLSTCVKRLRLVYRARWSVIVPSNTAFVIFTCNRADILKSS